MAGLAAERVAMAVLVVLVLALAYAFVQAPETRGGNANETLFYQGDFAVLVVNAEGAPLAGALSLSGVHDLTPLVQFSYNADIRLDAAQASALSPAFLPPRANVPLFIACGAAETSEFRRQSQLMWDAWPRHRRPAAGPLFIADKHHFDVVLEHADPESALTRETLALF